MRETPSDHTPSNHVQADSARNRSDVAREHPVAKWVPEKTAGVELRNFRDIRDRVVDTLLARMLEKLRTFEGISTQPEDLAKEAVEVLKQIDSELLDRHALK